MLLVIDVGNTNIVLGIYDGTTLLEHWRVETRSTRTADEMGILLLSLLQSRGRRHDEITATIISCVVPSLMRQLEERDVVVWFLEALLEGLSLDNGLIDKLNRCAHCSLISFLTSFILFFVRLLIRSLSSLD